MLLRSSLDNVAAVLVLVHIALVDVVGRGGRGNAFEAFVVASATLPARRGSSTNANSGQGEGEEKSRFELHGVDAERVN